MRARRVLQKSVPESADEIRQATVETTLVTDSQLTSDRTAVLREASGEDADRDPDKGHAVVWQLILMAVHGDHVTYDVATAGGGLIHAVRLPAVPAAALRLPTVPEGQPARRRRHLLERVP